MLQAHQQFADASVANDFNYDPTYNSNTYANTLLSILGIDTMQELAGATPTDVTDGFPGVGRNALNDATYTNDAINLNLLGLERSDTIVTGNGQDILRGGEGADTLRGGAGDDFLFGNNSSSNTFEIIDNNGTLIINPDFAININPDTSLPWIDAGQDLLFGGAGFDSYFVGVDIGTEPIDISDNIDISEDYIVHMFVDDNIIFNRDVYNQIDIINDTDGSGQIFHGLTFDDSINTLFGGLFNSTRNISLNSPVLLNDNNQISIETENEGIFTGYNSSILGRFYIDEGYSTGTTLLFFSNIFKANESIDNIALFAIEDWKNGDFGITIEGYGGSGRGTEDNDSLNGNDTGENLNGLGGDDIITGGIGNDVLNGGAGADQLLAGSGNDNVYFDEFDTVVDGNIGIDTAFFLGDTDFDYALDQGAFENAVFGDGDNTLYGGDSDNVINGGGGDDTLFGFSGNDRLVGGEGADSLQGGDGDDIITIDDDDIWFSGDAGIDTLVHNGASNITYALGQGEFENAEFGSGNDTIYGSEVDNFIQGGAGNDTLFGFGGNDLLIGQVGSDSLQGGDGNDTIVIDDNDTWWSGDTGIDTLIDVGVVGRTYALDQGAFENAEFGSGNDTIYGGEVANRIDGGSGNDNLFGFGGLDVLIGGEGDDSLFGGNDADIFIFSDNSGNDAVLDFENGLDVIDLSSHNQITDFNDVFSLATQVGSDVIIDFGNGATIGLVNVDLATEIDQSDFLFT